MPPRPARIIATAATLLIVLMCAGGASAGSPGAEFEVDLLGATGGRVASLVGSVDATGRGAATTAPLSGASALRMVRGENFLLRRRPDGTIIARGGLGSRIVIRTATGSQRAWASGHLARMTRGRAAVAVDGSGVSATRAYRPHKGDFIITVGPTSGPLRAALARRYRLLAYDPAADSRTALLGNPARYARIAGVLYGRKVSTSQIVRGNLARAFHNSGRFVGTTANPRTLDRAIGTVHFARLGRRPVIVRRATIDLGASGHTRMQLRQPVYARARAGQARGLAASLSASALAAFNRASSSALAKDLVRAEALTDRAAGTRGSRRETQTTTTEPPTITENNNSGYPLSYYSVQVQQQIYAEISVPGALSYAQCGDAAPTASGQWAFYSGTCPNATQTQQVQIDLEPTYTVSLVQSNQEVASQNVVETNYVQVSAVTNAAGSLASGTLGTTGPQEVTPQSLGPLGQSAYGFGWTWDGAYSDVQEAGLVLAQGVHQLLPACTSCTNTSGSVTATGATVSYQEDNSSPNETIQQVYANSQNGTNWSNSTSNTSGWNVSANLGAFGDMPTGGVSGGYNSSTTTSTTEGGSLSDSVSITYANWTTSPFLYTISGSAAGTGQLAQFTTTSCQVPGAAGTAAGAAYGVQFPSCGQATTTQYNQAGLIATPEQFGGQAGPGPGCSGLQGCAAQSAPSPFGFGAQMNATGYTGSSVAYYDVYGQGGQGSLAVGSITPNVIDNLQFVDQAIGTGAKGQVGLASAWTQVQVRNQQDVVIATTAGGATVSPTLDGAGIGSGITTYYSSTGAVESQSSTGGYQTTGLDLCAPPVLTQELWTAGCATSTSLSSNNPPALYSGSLPTISCMSSPTSTPTACPTSNSQQTAPAGATLSCSPGTWSGAPTSYSYQWQQWNSSFGVWNDVQGATSATFSPTTSGAYYLCGVTATNGWGSASGYSTSVLYNP